MENDSKQIFLNYRHNLAEACKKGYTHYLLSLRTSFHIEHFPSFRSSPTFWGFTWYAHSESSFSILTRILEKRRKSKQTITIYKFINFISQNKKNIFQTEVLDSVSSAIKSDNSFLDKKKSFLEKLMFLRDKFFSHFDKKFFKNISSSLSNFKIKDTEVEEIFFYIEEILNKYSVLFEGRKFLPELSDWKTVIDQEFRSFET